MFVGKPIMRALLVILLVDMAFSKSRKRDVSWFGSSKKAKVESPNLEQVHIKQPTPPYKLQDTQSLQESSQKLKSITDVIDETLTDKLHDTVMEEALKKDLTYRPVGCYKDDVTNHALPEELADLQSSINWANLGKTVKICAFEAKKAGYQVFGIQKFGICYSGKNAWHTYDKYGKSKDCTNGVGRFGSNFVYTFKPKVVPMKRPTVYCFPNASQVETQENHRVPMSNLHIGDRVKTLDRHGKTVYSEVIAFLHRQEKTTADYLSIVTSNGHTLRTSPKHLVFNIDNTTNKISAVFAEKIKVGDSLQTVGRTLESSRVVKITMATAEGVYAPLTRHGTMLVDGVLVSCYAHWDSHTVAHVTMAPLRLWTDMTSLMTSLSSLFGFPGNQGTRIQPHGINWYALSLMNIVEKFVSLQ